MIRSLLCSGAIYTVPVRSELELGSLAVASAIDTVGSEAVVASD